MMIFLSLFGAVWLVGLLILVVGMLRAPEGHQSERGFHLGPPPKRQIDPKSESAGAPASEPVPDTSCRSPLIT